MSPRVIYRLNGFSATADFRQRLRLIIILQRGNTHCNTHTQIRFGHAYVPRCTQLKKAELILSQKVPFLKVRVVLRVVLVTGLLQGVVEEKRIFFVDINWSQVCASTEPPLLTA